MLDLVQSNIPVRKKNEGESVDELLPDGLSAAAGQCTFNKHYASELSCR